jgi:hypothetical protein
MLTSNTDPIDANLVYHAVNASDVDQIAAKRVLG